MTSIEDLESRIEAIENAAKRIRVATLMLNTLLPGRMKNIPSGVGRSLREIERALEELEEA
ncbi:MAG: hypothetical protein OXD46_10500 [Chloroflexi bacterium]|nr:hypothetical protein [Chloroflexota bacterium]